MASPDPGITAIHDTSKETPPSDPSSGPRHRFRADLEIVGAGETGSEVIVRDARSGQQHSFTADEFRLCRAGDGTRTLFAIRQEFNAQTGRDFPLGKVFKFFGRLRSLGLLEESAADQSAAATADDTHQLIQAQSRNPAPLERQDDAATPSIPMPAPRTEDLAAASPRPDESPSFETKKRQQARRERVIWSQWPSKADSPRAAANDPATRANEAGRSLAVTARTDEAGKRENLADIRTGANRAIRLARRAARRDSAEDAAHSRGPVRLSFFDPDFAFGILSAIARRLRYLLAASLLLAIPAAIWIVWQEREMLAGDISAFDVAVVGTIILGLAIANLISRVIQGGFISAFGGAVKQFGIALTSIVPRFFVDLSGIAALGRRGQLWAHAAPLIARLALFCAGVLLWFVLRRSAPALSHLCLIVGQIGLLAFMLSAWPLLPSDGYRWMATFFGRPDLRANAGRLLAAMVTRAAQGAKAGSGASAPVIFYVLAIALVASIFALAAQMSFDIATAGQAGLVTEFLLPLVGVALAAWAVAVWRYGQDREVEALEPGAIRHLRAHWGAQADFAAGQQVTAATVGKVVWAVILTALLAVAFLPYRYQAGGRFEILPTQRTVVTARTSGEIEKVLVREGDWVVANQVLAELSSKDQQRDISIANAELEHAKAQLAQFGSTEQQNGQTRARREAADTLNDQPGSPGEKEDLAAANYTRAQAERAARADVERLTRKLAHARDQLANTTIRAPSAGRVVTPNVHLLIGTFRRRGAELLTLEDTRKLAAEIDLPEADVGLIKIGDNVRLRPWAEEDREISGVVAAIAPAAQVKSYGTIVRVEASLQDPEGSLRPAMSGYAKIDAEEMRVWQAFLRKIIRVVRVEIWSWLP